MNADITPEAWADLCSRPQYFKAALDSTVYDVRKVWRALRSGSITVSVLHADVSSLFPLVGEAVSDLAYCLQVRKELPIIGVEWLSPPGSIEIRVIDGWHRIGRKMIDVANLKEEPCVPALLVALKDVDGFVISDPNITMHTELCNDPDTQAFMYKMCMKFGVYAPDYFRLSELMATNELTAARAWVADKPELFEMITKLDIIA